MSRDFRLENGFPRPLAHRDIRFSPQNLRDCEAGAGSTRIYPRKLDTNYSVTLPYRPYQLKEELPDLLQKLHACEPLCCSENQRELARKALAVLKNRKKEDIRNLAKSVADDVAGAVD